MIVAPNLPRLRTLDIYFDRDAANKILTLPRGSLPMLKQLRLDVERQNIIDADLSTIFDVMPNLQKLHLSFKGFDIYRSDPSMKFPLHIPWAQLTHLTLDSEGYHDPSIFEATAVADILREANNLIYLNLAIVNSHERDITATPQSVSLPRLRHLLLGCLNELRAPSSSYAPGILERIAVGQILLRLVAISLCRSDEERWSREYSEIICIWRRADRT
ncbi:hypothetical protein DXG03_004303 [Asterophora parasitica]|uniref:Uncharacterized protein n=1 Tax=Asterophora parasitica TaxID=117018 RepID=A0A9P7K919_9AGAR|nr:hypothetical protein DXG03_004303 [Asterophora parasitica]